MKQIQVIENQTLLDVALQHYGNAEAIGELLLLNPNLRNNPGELQKHSLDPDSCSLDVKLNAGDFLTVDENSMWMRKNIVRRISKEITTYGTNN